MGSCFEAFLSLIFGSLILSLFYCNGQKNISSYYDSKLSTDIEKNPGPILP